MTKKKRPPIDWPAVEAAMLRSFSGRPREGDQKICDDAYRRSPKKYGTVNDRVRFDEVQRIRGGGIP